MTFLIRQTLIYSVPLMIVALAGVFAERSGIINLALEGIMIFGAFAGVVFVRFLQSTGLFDAAKEAGSWLSLQGYLLLSMLVTAAVGSLFSLLLAVPIFAILNLFTFSAATMLKISMVLALLMVFLYTFQLDRIVRKVLHVDDKGYTSVHEDEEEIASKVSDNFIVTVVKGIGSVVKQLGLWGLIFGAVALFAVLEYVIIGGAILVVVVIVYIFYRIGKNRRHLNDFTVWMDVLGSLISLALSAVMLIADPAGDEFYYFAAIACIVGVGLSATLSMRRFNELATRPLPRFFDREAGGEN